MVGLNRPREPRVGRDLAGTVEAVGRNVTRLKPGDEVFGTGNGSCAEYACASESKLAVKPAKVTFEQAASIPVAGITALQGLRDTGKIRPGQKVLINGAAGGVGTFAVQIAKHFGADITGVCGARNADMVRSLGAARVIDYEREDFTKGPERYDLVLDNVGNRSFSELRRLLTPNGICVIAGAPKEMRGALKTMLSGMMRSLVSKNLRFVLAKINPQDLTAIAELNESGKVTPVVERRYTLGEVPEAIRYLETGHVRGKLVVIPG
jgi:NADPH:quinone reductase-like Zn-dependent oxidoreductase